MSEYTEYVVIPSPSADAIRERLIAERVRSVMDQEENELMTWPTPPEDHRFIVVFTLDATLDGR
jgi:hypothetical protein